MGTTNNLETSAASKHIGHMILLAHRNGHGTEIQKHEEEKNQEFHKNMENLHPLLHIVVT